MRDESFFFLHTDHSINAAERAIREDCFPMSCSPVTEDDLESEDQAGILCEEHHLPLFRRWIRPDGRSAAVRLGRTSI